MIAPPELIGNLAYLASPYTNFEGGHFAAWCDAATVAGKLVAAGIPLYCPIAHSHPMVVYADLDPCDLSIWNPLNDQFMPFCKALIVVHLDGWDQSEGIKREVAYFEKIRRPIYDCDPVTLTLTRRQAQRPPRQRADDWTDEQIAADRANWLGDNPPLAHAKSPSEQGGASV